MKRSRLRADPDRVREWQQKSRKPLDPGVPKRRATITAEVRESVRLRSGGWCVVCLFRVGYPGGVVVTADWLAVRKLSRVRTVRRVAHLHHVLPVQTFPRWDRTEENLVGVCTGCHDEHERAHRRIPYAALPVAVREFTRLAGHQESLFMDRTYPK